MLVDLFESYDDARTCERQKNNQAFCFLSHLSPMDCVLKHCSISSMSSSHPSPQNQLLLLSLSPQPSAFITFSLKFSKQKFVMLLMSPNKITHK